MTYYYWGTPISKIANGSFCSRGNSLWFTIYILISETNVCSLVANNIIIAELPLLKCEKVVLIPAPRLQIPFRNRVPTSHLHVDSLDLTQEC